MIAPKNINKSENRPDIVEDLEGTNIRVNEFRKLRKKKDITNALQIYSVVRANCLRQENFSLGFQKFYQTWSNELRLSLLISEYKVIFKSEPPSGLPPERQVEHENNITEESKLPHRRLYPLSPTEQNPLKKYIEDLFDSGNIRTSKSPYGPP